LANVNKPALQLKDHILRLTGAWITLRLNSDIIEYLRELNVTDSPLTIDCSEITQLDTNGACLLHEFIQKLQDSHIDYDVRELTPEHQQLFELAGKYKIESPPAAEEETSILAQLGRGAIAQWQEIKQLLAFLGEIASESLKWITNPHKIRWLAVLNGMDKTGYQALGIISLLSFLIGVVLCYQMGLQLETYGATIYVVDLLGLAILREFAPLLTAIIVAGRTGSAYAAQIGTMKLNQEVDALKTFGVSPTELLVLPKMSALLVALPLLTVLSMFMGIFGGMVMAKLMFNIHYIDFLHRFGDVIPFKTIVLGMIKTPVFAVLIATIGCFQGFRVSGSAASVGQHTTISVVQAIFMIIVTDAIFSIIYSELGL
jgi:phospholipid/cholesterol/gamma-HCH transport system permease protein